MKYLTINPSLCLGCTACALICSATWQGEFNPQKAYVQIKKQDRIGAFKIIFSSECKQCKKCGIECPSGALAVIDIADASKEDK